MPSCRSTAFWAWAPAWLSSLTTRWSSPTKMQNAMSQPLIVSVPHRLGRQEARRRLDRGIGRLQPELGILFSGLNYHWQGDTLNFIASAMWQQVTGRIEVLDDAVGVEIDLPWVMRLLRDTIAKRVRGRGIALLAKPPDEV